MVRQLVPNLFIDLINIHSITLHYMDPNKVQETFCL